MSQVAFDIIAGKVDNKVVKCNWQSIRLIGTVSIQIDALMTTEQLYQFKPVEWHNNLTRGFYRLIKTHSLVQAKDALDPSLKGVLEHPNRSRRTEFTKWTFGIIDENRYKIPVAVQARPDGRWNVSAAKFMRYKGHRVAGLVAKEETLTEEIVFAFPNELKIEEDV